LRSPIFCWKNLDEAVDFVQWVAENEPHFQAVISTVSRHAKLVRLRKLVEGNTVILGFEYSTGDASGQNMVTISTHAVCEFIVKNYAVAPANWHIESGHSGDKKPSVVAFYRTRGKRVVAEVVLSPEIVANVLKSTPKHMAEYVLASAYAMAEIGTVGLHAHLANGLTAIFLACGQDVACIAEAAVGLTRMEVTDAGELYVAMTLPNLIVGTVGGGTSLPTQRECLRLIGCEGAGNSGKFAEICAAVALAGELSIVAALTEGHFVQAHASLGRKKEGN
jgi:hydroxymethylglutaryl-CoA reductase (NADPH)